MPGPGLTLSNAAPVFAPDETSKLQATLANAASGVPVLSATLNRTFGVSLSSQLTKDFYVKTIRTDGNGAYVIGYVLDGTEAEVTIPASACMSGDCEVTVDGRSYFFWSWTGYDPFAHEEFQYMDSFNLLSFRSGWSLSPDVVCFRCQNRKPTDGRSHLQWALPCPKLRDSQPG